MDQKCLNCSTDVTHLQKLFKIACLAYQPNSVSYRSVDFTREQMHTMRKFLVGQAAQLILQSKTMKKLGLSSKKVFDDIYLYI